MASGRSEEDAAVRGLVQAYKRTAQRWDELQPDTEAANDVFEENHAIYKQLRAHGEGRAGISQLMDHSSKGVRLLAATHSLGWTPDVATAVLKEIERGDGLHSVTAKWTLRSFQSGQLNLEW